MGRAGWRVSWTTDTIAAMQRPRRAPCFLVSILPQPTAPGARLSFSSRPVPGYDPRIGGVTASWSSISLDTWQSSPSRATVTIVGLIDWSGVRRGSIVQISVLEQGDDEIEAYRVFVGRLWDAQCAAGITTIEAIGLDGALWSQAVPGTDGRVFLSAETVGATTANWATGDTTMSVTGIGAAPVKPGGEPYLLLVTRPNGVQFYVFATNTIGTPVTAFTGVTTGALDSLATNAGSGSTVQVIPYASIHPLTVASRIFRGGGAWPANWQAGESPGFWDDARLSQILALPDADPGVGWRWTMEEPAGQLADGLAALPDAGMGLTMRQGMVAPWIAMDPYAMPTRTIDPRTVADVEWTGWGETPSTGGIEVTDRSRRPQGTYAQNVATTDAWRSLVMAYRFAGLEPPTPADTIADAAQSSRIALVPFHRPTSTLRRVGLPLYGTSGQRSAWREAVVRRLYRWHVDPPQRIRVRLVGWHPMAAGDYVSLDYPAIPGRGGPSDDLLRGAPMLVVGGGPDLGGAFSTYDLAYVPPTVETVT